ncbi:MAG: 4'-phosphopantetheinyl transferase superfamily protein, partial [bacterium]
SLPQTSLKQMEACLAPDERNRATRFRFSKDRNKFIVCRFALRNILASYSGTIPELVQFSYGPQGKPYLSDQSTLRFNVSHSGGMALVVAACGREVGVDIEQHYTARDLQPIAERFFSPREFEAIQMLPPLSREEAFFRVWTCKEAYLKAKGVGLSGSLDRFEVSVLPGQPAELLSVLDDPDEPGRWSMRNFCPSPNYSAALAVEGHDWSLSSHLWKPSFQVSMAN